MNIFFLVYAVVFTLFHIACMAGLFREFLLERRSPSALSTAGGAVERLEKTPLVSIIVPARNEGACLGELLSSLETQSYPNVEFVFVDDRSSDSTGQLFRSFADRHPDNTVILRLDENPGPNHKQFALTRALEIAKGLYLLFTDADCVVAPDWAAAMASRLSDENTGLVIGPVFKRIEGAGFFRAYQAFDHAVRYMYLAATSGLGQACGGFGNNLIIKRAALDAIGGYQAVPASQTEDAALVGLVRSQGRFAIRSALSKDVSVLTKPVTCWRELIVQGLRWNNGGLFAPDLNTRAGFGALMGMISIGMLAIPLCLVWPRFWPLPLTVFFSMMMDTIAVIRMCGNYLPRNPFRIVFPAIFTPIYFTFLTLLGVLGVKAKWKDECPKPTEKRA